MKQIIKKALSKNKAVFLCFVNMNKAFNSIKREAIWKRLEVKKVNLDSLSTIKNLYETTNNQIRTRNRTSISFKAMKGVKQGAGISALLFICTVDDIITE